MTDIVTEARELVKRWDGCCLRCGFRLAKDRGSGCVPGDCSYRPEKFIPLQVDAPAALLAELCGELEQVRAERDRLQKALKHIAIQDYEDDGYEHQNLERSDVGTLAGALRHCGQTARAALEPSDG